MRKKKALGDLKRKKRLRKKNELKEQIIRKGKKKTLAQSRLGKMGKR